MHKERVILLTGASGQVGYELMRSLQGLGKVVVTDRATMDLSDATQIRDAVRTIKPALIVNPAAYTEVDKAEADAASVTRINVDAPRVLAEEAKRVGAPLVHYSTDYVFDGTKTTAYVEQDEANPQNVYGSTKLAGERAIIESGCAHLILRTSWVYGTRGKNFLLTMLRLGAQRSELSVVADQYGAPTWANTIAALTSNVLAQAVEKTAGDWDDWWSSRSGVYHLTASGETSWHAFAQAIFELSDLAVKPLVKPIPAASYPTVAVRPFNSRLSNDKLADTFGVRAPDWRDALRLCMAAR